MHPTFHISDTEVRGEIPFLLEVMNEFFALSEIRFGKPLARSFGFAEVTS